MRRHAALAALLLLAVVPAAGASPQRSFTFGRLGGNIRPYTVTITSTGSVSVSGAATAGRMKLTPAQLAVLDRAVTEAHFGAFLPMTNCPGTLPDIATTFIRFGAKTARVHGSCVARYTKLFTALRAAVKLS
jgi:hypothetical protein